MRPLEQLQPGKQKVNGGGQGLGGENRELACRGHRIPVFQDKVLETDAGDSPTAM